jgi:CDGSH-type Zn-finger protein/uncharacterized Fe-S cluster protein YjdI
VAATKLDQYKGKNITVVYDAQRCIHAKECVRGVPPVFSLENNPWVNPDNSEAKAIAGVIQRCPTGALHYFAEDSKLAEHPDPSNTVKTNSDGPLFARGNVNLVTENGDPLLSDTRMALCRCGASQNKPFCDNSHFAIAFDDPGMAAPGESASSEMATSGKLNVIPTADGPFHLQGQVTIRNAAGEVIFEGIETWLCRCGASANKPYCDGSHQRIGFKSI